MFSVMEHDYFASLLWWIFLVVYSMFAGLIIIAAFFASSVAMLARRQIVHIASGP